jgi:predicted CXXCH cytochrome family protein
MSIIALLLCFMPLLTFGQGMQGDCSDCHTMHNSEQGQAVAILGSDAESTSATPIRNLLKFDCVACHANSSTGDKVMILPGGSQIPQVYHGDTTDLAAGNFAYIDGTKSSANGSGASDRKGHNVVDLVEKDSTLSEPPGWKHRLDGDKAMIWDAGVGEMLTCSGRRGCHGVRNQMISMDPLVVRDGLAAMTGTHHNNVNGLIDGTEGREADVPANSYRFLQGLYGLENPDADHRWENFDKDSHNEYYGKSERIPTNWGDGNGCYTCHYGTSVSTTSYIRTPNNSMSGFCSTCHSNFHSTGVNNGSSGAFLRHPSDYIIPNRGEYAAYTTYDVSIPVARQTLTSSSSDVVAPGSDIVMCLSCHVPHASGNEGMLRFNYTDMTAGGYETLEDAQNMGGCVACHTAKGVLPENR